MCVLHLYCLVMLVPMVRMLLIPLVMGTTSMRYLDPVVLTGSDVPSLLGCAECVDRLVGFSWVEGAWDQVPVQVRKIGVYWGYYILYWVG